MTAVTGMTSSEPALDRPRHGSRRLTYVWLALCALTIGSAMAAATAGDGHQVAISLVVLLVGAVKVRLVLQEFMELRHAPAWLARLTDAWLLFVVTFVGLMHTF
jgi:hypothetical protein